MPLSKHCCPPLIFFTVGHQRIKHYTYSNYLVPFAGYVAHRSFSFPNQMCIYVMSMSFNHQLFCQCLRLHWCCDVGNVTCSNKHDNTICASSSFGYSRCLWSILIHRGTWKNNLRGHERGTLISWLSTLGNYLCVPKGYQCVLEEGTETDRRSKTVKLRTFCVKSTIGLLQQTCSSTTA